MTTRRNRPVEITDAPEHRTIPIDQIELREADGKDENEVVLVGYASTFEPYEMYGGPAQYGWIEQLDRKAFDKTLKEKPDLHLLINHAGMPLARTKSGTLDLGVDKHGLKVTARLDKRDPEVQALAVKMERGDMDEMSFAFRVKGQAWKAADGFEDDDQSHRTITEVSLHKGDVSVVNWGANPSTHVEVKSVDEAIKVLAECEVGQLAEVREGNNDLLVRAVEKLGQLTKPGKPDKNVNINIENMNTAAAKVKTEKLAVSDTPWSTFSRFDYTEDQWKAACLIDTGEGEGRARYKLPVREPNGTLNRHGLRAMTKKIDDLEGITEDLRSATARKMIGFYRELEEDTPTLLDEVAARSEDPDFVDPPATGMPLRDALVPPPKRGMSLRDALTRQGLLSEDGKVLSLAEATSQ